MICYILAVYFIFYQNIHRVHFVNYNWQKKLWLWSKSNRHITYNFENWQKKADYRSSDDSAITDDTFSLFQEAANAETWKNNFQCIYIQNTIIDLYFDMATLIRKLQKRKAWYVELSAWEIYYLQSQSYKEGIYSLGHDRKRGSWGYKSIILSTEEWKQISLKVHLIKKKYHFEANGNMKSKT